MKRGRPAKYGRKIKRDPDEALARCAANAAESMRRITLTLQQANAAGLSYGQYVAEERKKAMKGLPKEKIEEVQALIDSGAKRAEIAEQTGVSTSTITRIKSGQLTSADKPEKPSPAPKPRADKPEIVRVLITQALEQLRSEYDGLDCKEVGQAIGLLTAAEMMLEG